MGNAVDRLLEGIEHADVGERGAFAAHAVLDATVPEWRFSVRGAGPVEAQMDRWYAGAGHFEEVDRRPVAGGEVVRFSLTWVEDGVPHACHQIHVLELEGDEIVRDTMFCGGRWPASLLAEMEAARAAH
jgi:hypothetical protein